MKTKIRQCACRPNNKHFNCSIIQILNCCGIDQFAGSKGYIRATFEPWLTNQKFKKRNFPKDRYDPIMGSDLSQFRDIRLTKEDLTVSAGKSILDYFDFDKYSFDGTVSIDEWEYFFGDKFDLFLSYDSNLDEVYSSHIADIRANLEAKGLRVWFDNKHDIGEELRIQVAKAIDNSSVVVIIVTASYLQNVNGDNPKDRCRLEFEYASKWKPISNIVPVVIEAKVSDKRIWDGAIGFVFDSVPCLNLCPTGDGIVHTDELLKKILTITGTSMNEQLAQIDWMQTLGSSKLPSAPGKLALVGNKLQFSPDLERIEMLKKELLDWLIDQLKVVRVAERCSKILYDVGILSVDRLQRKLRWNRRALLDLGFDQFDSEDIAEAFDETVKVCILIVLIVFLVFTVEISSMSERRSTKAATTAGQMSHRLWASFPRYPALWSTQVECSWHYRLTCVLTSPSKGTHTSFQLGIGSTIHFHWASLTFRASQGHTVWQGKRTRISSSSMKQRRSGQVVVETGLPSERALRPSSALKPWAATPEPAGSKQASKQPRRCSLTPSLKLSYPLKLTYPNAVHSLSAEGAIIWSNQTYTFEIIRLLDTVIFCHVLIVPSHIVVLFVLFVFVFGHCVAI